MRTLMTVCLLVLALLAPGCRKPFRGTHAARDQQPMEAPRGDVPREPVEFQGLDLLPPGWEKVHAYPGPNHMVAYLRWQGEGQPLMVNALSARTPEEAARWVRRAFAAAGAAPGTLGRRGVAGLQTERGERAFGVALGTVAVMVKGQAATGILPSAYMVGLLQGNAGVSVTAAFEPPADEGEGDADTMDSLLEELGGGAPMSLEPPPELPVVERRPVIAEPDLLDTGLDGDQWEPLPAEEVESVREPAGEPVGLVAAAPGPSDHHSVHGDHPADPVDVPPFRKPEFPVETAATEAELPTRGRVEEAVREAARLVAQGAPAELTQVASAATPPRGQASRAPLSVIGTMASPGAASPGAASPGARGGSPFGAGASPLPPAASLPPAPTTLLPPPARQPGGDVALASALEMRLAGGTPMWSEASAGQLVDDGRKLLALAQVHAAYDRFVVAAHRGSPAARQHVDALRKLFPDAFPTPPSQPPPPAAHFTAEDGEPPAATRAPVEVASMGMGDSPFTGPDEDEVVIPEEPNEQALEAAEAADARAAGDAEPVTPGEILLSLARRGLAQGDYRSALDRYAEAEARGMHEGTLGRREVARILERRALELTGRMWAGEVGASDELQQLHLRFPEVFPEDDPTVLAAAAPAAAAPLASRRRRSFYVEALGLIGFLALVGVVSTRPVDPEDDFEVPPTVAA